jgi:hypothetical protein
MTMNLELRRKACEALGWTRFQSYGNGGGFWHRNGCEEVARNSSCKCGGNWFLPAIETDPAVSEPMFLEWCEKNDCRWEVATCEPHGQFTERHIAIWVHRVKDDTDIEVEGATPSECRAKAIVRAAIVAAAHL